MKGNVLNFDTSTNKEIISGFDGNRYYFARIDWKSDGLPEQNCEVDFIIEENEAKEIFRLSPKMNTESIRNLGILNFLFPLIGLILYLAWMKSKPIESERVGKATLWGFLFYYIVLMLSSP